jgi:hypothetical protein
VVHDPERIERTRQALEAADLDALVCTLPANVLLLSGYWPVKHSTGHGVGFAAIDHNALPRLHPESDDEL